MKLISFIVPAFNAATYLESCLKSIYLLDMGAFDREVIVVDDGSTDGTSSLLVGLQSLYPAMKVISQSNQGLSVARNAGLAVAEGKYICFVDADDEIDTVGGALFPFQCLANEDVDLYGINMNLVTTRGLKPYRRYVPIYNYIYRPARKFVKGRNIQPCAYGYLYRRAFLEEKGLYFHVGIYHEDEEWTPMVFLQAESFVALNVNFYRRYLRPNSITTTRDKNRQELKLRHMLQVIRTLELYLQHNQEYRPYLQHKMDYLCVDLLTLLHRQRHRAVFRKEMVGELRSMGYFPLRKHREFKYKVFRLLSKCIY